MLAPWKESYDQPREHIKNTKYILKITLPTKVCLVKAMVFPVVMYGCESWTIKIADNEELLLLNLVLEKTLESLLDCREIQPVNSKGIVLNIHWKD